jgi:hypothetical protein
MTALGQKAKFPCPWRITACPGKQTSTDYEYTPSFARPGDPTWSTAFRKVEQPSQSVDDLIIDMDRRSRAVRFNVIENGDALSECMLRPDQFHARAFALCNAEAHRSANCASATALSTSGRLSSSASRTFARNQAS